ncbi:MAG: hypothetical protein EBU49_05760, partial [Proteobacteria bacterium]|nr:hypothetical protein [Pseudomonadota bacterium]
YGHIERYEHRVDHMRRLRDLQDETGGFNVFIPLAFQPYQNDMGIGRYTFGFDDLKTIAVARLYLDNFANIKSYWVMLGQDIAQLGLSFGANDFDGTVTEEKISRMAGGRAGMVMSRSDLEHLILRAGRTPVERDTLYRPIDLEKSLARAAEMRASAGDASPLMLPVASARKLSFATTPNTVQLNAEDPANLDWKSLMATCQELARVPSPDARRQIVLSGLTATSKLMEEASIPFEKGFADLATAGVRRLIETAADATNENLNMIHKAAHRADLPTSGRVELRAFTNQAHTGEPAASRIDWKAFQSQLNRVSQAMRPLGMTAISLEASRDGVITAGEYLDAIQKLRSAAGDQAEIVTSILSHVPTLAPAMGLGSDGSQHPVQKLVPLLADFGANDLGLIDPAMIKVNRLVEDIRCAGLAAAGAWPSDHSDSNPGLDLRHKPDDRN